MLYFLYINYQLSISLSLRTDYLQFYIHISRILHYKFYIITLFCSPDGRFGYGSIEQ